MEYSNNNAPLYRPYVNSPPTPSAHGRATPNLRPRGMVARAPIEYETHPQTYIRNSSADAAPPFQPQPHGTLQSRLTASKAYSQQRPTYTTGYSSPTNAVQFPAPQYHQPYSAYELKFIGEQNPPSVPYCFPQGWQYFVGNPTILQQGQIHSLQRSQYPSSPPPAYGSINYWPNTPTSTNSSASFTRSDEADMMRRNNISSPPSPGFGSVSSTVEAVGTTPTTGREHVWTSTPNSALKSPSLYDPVGNGRWKENPSSSAPMVTARTYSPRQQPQCRQGVGSRKGADAWKKPETDWYRSRSVLGNRRHSAPAFQPGQEGQRHGTGMEYKAHTPYPPVHLQSMYGDNQWPPNGRIVDIPPKVATSPATHDQQAAQQHWEQYRINHIHDGSHGWQGVTGPQDPDWPQLPGQNENQEMCGVSTDNNNSNPRCMQVEASTNAWAGVPQANQSLEQKIEDVTIEDKEDEVDVTVIAAESITNAAGEVIQDMTSVIQEL